MGPTCPCIYFVFCGVFSDFVTHAFGVNQMPLVALGLIPMGSSHGPVVAIVWVLSWDHTGMDLQPPE